MTAPIRPAAAKAYGREKWLFVPAIADPDAPKVTEINAGGGLDMSCYFYTDSGRPDVSQNRVQAPQRICDTEQFESLGSASWTGGDALYAVDPQGATGSDGKKALETLPEGTTGFLVRRFGIQVDDDVATGDFVSAFPVEWGVVLDTTEGDGEAAEVAIKQAYAITGRPSILKAVVAGP
ncbi:MAG TPA: hypothetical protein VFL94_02110 [Actinomycetales bacterium]|nr:hypothetical protein [Actinomycetales bacterium]